MSKKKAKPAVRKKFATKKVVTKKAPRKQAATQKKVTKKKVTKKKATKKAALQKAGPKPKQILRGIPDIRRFFYSNDTPIYFISATNFNLLGAD